ncbi:PIN domain-containing protein [Altererythrobacter sp. Root672]|uniref:PIN domain-containing protein n=1 Tax=Altererythrobacter sp. Root672 TaxID=1736584 RepID=UPI0006F5A756|nr:PIN domain-containing protein [Altererythrobacter sp. Root672]KRA82705.1 twitching motility protein PilT [Altererythrobacter sp. Root672]
MYLLDTGMLLDLREARRAGSEQALAAWAERTSAQQMFLSALTLLELENAAAVAARRGKDAGLAWRDWLDRQVSPAFDGRILPVDAAVVRRRAQIPYADDREGILAATALVNNLTLVTSEPRTYRAGRVKVLDPARFEPDSDSDADWREATRSGAAWLRNLLIR